MSFGGSVGAMISSIKNNKRTRPSAFKKLKESGVEYTIRTELHFDKKSSPEKLRRIKEKIKKEQQVAFRKKVILFSLVLVIFILVISFVKF
ncbi:MAG: hypothetical protein JXQ93_02985 [Flavobacteriaceae bacterium]